MIEIRGGRYRQALHRTELAKRLGKLRPDDSHPRLADKIAREFPDLRGQFDEARRMNIDELRQFQK